MKGIMPNHFSYSPYQIPVLKPSNESIAWCSKRGLPNLDLWRGNNPYQFIKLSLV